jgi:hypothetical protein
MILLNSEKQCLEGGGGGEWWEGEREEEEEEVVSLDVIIMIRFGKYRRKL